MKLLQYFRSRRSLFAELETLREANIALAKQLETERIRSWMRLNPSPKALVLPEKPASKRTDPHPVQPGRHHRAEPVTETYPRPRKSRTP